MGTDEFWNIIATARANTTGRRPFDVALADVLAERPPAEILAYAEAFATARSDLERWDVWAAAYLIGGGCSDDSFMDFRAGVISLGREWYERVLAHPDSLAGHPQLIAGEEYFFHEAVNYAAAGAFRRVTDGSEDFYAAWDRYRAAAGLGRRTIDMGEDFDFDDDEEMRRRLPRLFALLEDEDEDEQDEEDEAGGTEG
ncbi:DUF4240 domain-containing protein [Streptomyces sp. NPDC057638]|uniref:DUF4240 domain-containing protein n=1 Tax=Streptomyces sp. NPDC057638 TaxID=3346190 RepID=UPI0036A7D64B